MKRARDFDASDLSSVVSAMADLNNQIASKKQKFEEQLAEDEKILEKLKSQLQSAKNNPTPSRPPPQKSWTSPGQGYTPVSPAPVPAAGEDSNSTPQEVPQEYLSTTKLLIKGIPFSMEEPAIRSTFSIPDSTHLELILSRKGLFFGTVHATCETPEDATEIMKQNGKAMDDRTISVSYFRLSEEEIKVIKDKAHQERLNNFQARQNRGPRIFGPKHDVMVSNLQIEASQDDIGAYFSEVGEVLEVRIVYDKETGISKRCCFVRFADEEGANRAVWEMHDSEFQDRYIRVQLARPST